MRAFLEQIDSKTLVPLLVTTVVAIVGWYIVHYFTSARELQNKRLELRTQYLLEAYRKLERSVGSAVNQTVVDDLESALADLQLLGDEKQIEATTHRSLILETNSEIWKFSFQRVNELKTKPVSSVVGSFGGKLAANFPQKWENFISSKDSIS